MRARRREAAHTGCLSLAHALSWVKRTVGRRLRAGPQKTLVLLYRLVTVHSRGDRTREDDGRDDRDEVDDPEHGADDADDQAG